MHMAFPAVAEGWQMATHIAFVVGKVVAHLIHYPWDHSRWNGANVRAKRLPPGPTQASKGEMLLRSERGG